MRLLRAAMAAVLLMPSALPAAEPSAELTREQLKDQINAGDIISINIFPGEEYSREVTVQPDGRIQMGLIGAVMVKGLSVSELQDRIRLRYAKFLDKPQVTANVRRFSGRRVSIIGEIRSAGYYEFRDGMRLLELVSTAGGVDTDASLKRIHILRPGIGGKRQSLDVDFRRVLKGDLSRDPLLMPGDTVYIPQKSFTSGANWINRNILPWAIVTSIITSLVVSTRRL